MPQIEFIEKAVELATENESLHGGLPYGAVVVKDGKIVGMGVNEVVQTGDPTAHAEMLAIRSACAKLDNPDLSGYELYASAHPCAMCLGAIYYSNIRSVYYREPRNSSQDYVYGELKLDDDKRAVRMIRLP
jgi:guanine deaminase